MRLRLHDANPIRSRSLTDSHVDELDVGQVVLVGTGEEVLGRNEGAGEGGDTVPRLRELQSESSRTGRRHRRDIGVGRDLERGKTAGDDCADQEAGRSVSKIACGRHDKLSPSRNAKRLLTSSANNKASKRRALVVGRQEVSDRPEKDSTERVDCGREKEIK